MYTLEFRIAGIKLRCKIKATSRNEAIEKLKKTLVVDKCEGNYLLSKDWSEIFETFGDFINGKKKK